MNTLEERIARAVREEICIAPYDAQRPALFQSERNHLRACLPAALLGHIEREAYTNGKTAFIANIMQYALATSPTR